LKDATNHLNKLRRDEEIKWAQRAKVKHVQKEEITTNIFILLLMESIERKQISTRARRGDYRGGTKSKGLYY
jgi:hypothetical protein